MKLILILKRNRRLVAIIALSLLSTACAFAVMKISILRASEDEITKMKKVVDMVLNNELQVVSENCLNAPIPVCKLKLPPHLMTLTKDGEIYCYTQSNAFVVVFAEGMDVMGEHAYGYMYVSSDNLKDAKINLVLPIYTRVQPYWYYSKE